MALGGTFETLSVIDLVSWLDSLGRTGVLTVSTGGGELRVWMVPWGIAAAESPSGRPLGPAEALFEVLTAGPVPWRFETGAATGGAGAPAPLVEVVERLDAMIMEWEELAALVPSGGASIRLAAEIHGEVLVDADRWELVIALSSGPRPVDDLLGSAGDLVARRRLAELVRAGLAAVDPA